MSRLLPKLFAAALLLPSHAFAGPRAQGGYAQDCGRLTQSSKFDEYGVVSAAEEAARLDRLAAALKEVPEDTKAFIIGYAGRGGRAGDGIRRADRARQTLADKPLTFGLYNPRLNTLDCGRRETPATEIWLTPAGASPPRCAPTLDPVPAKGGAVRPRPRRGSGRL